MNGSRRLGFVAVTFAITLFVALELTPARARADDTSGSTAGSASSDQMPEHINVQNLKEKYWAKGEENEMRVIQHRTYSRAGKFELGVFGSTISSDPFLNIEAVGARLGYYFSDYFGINFFAWKTYVKASSAEDFLEQQQHVQADTNAPSSFYGGELTWAPVYGKLSILGKMIIYYDLHLSGGAGLTPTQTGNELTPFIGIGQEFYLTRNLALGIDYKEMFYNDNPPNNQSATPGALLGTRSVTTGAVLVSLNLLLF